MLLHVVTEKGHGFKPAVEDPTSYHAPAPFYRRNGSVVKVKPGGDCSYTKLARDTILERMRAEGEDFRLHVLPATLGAIEEAADRRPWWRRPVFLAPIPAVAGLLAAGVGVAGAFLLYYRATQDPLPGDQVNIGDNVTIWVGKAQL